MNAQVEWENKSQNSDHFVTMYSDLSTMCRQEYQVMGNISAASNVIWLV